jgi:hypothetical protein
MNRLPRAAAFAAFSLAAWLPAPAAWAQVPPRFANETARAGIEHRYEGGWEFFVGGGVATFDCDGDGRPDLYFAGGSAPASLYRNTSALGGALSFVELDRPALAVKDATGAYPLDIDSDGHLDLAVLRVGENVLFRGLGGCRFERANEAWGFDGGDAWTTAFSARWDKGRAWPTLVFANYVDRAKPGAPFGTCHANDLIRPGAGPGFSPPEPLAPGYCALSALFSDWRRDGSPDLWLSNDRQYHRGGQEQLWRIPPSGKPRPYTADEGWRKLTIWGMGIATYDVNGNGIPEYFLTSMGDNKLRTLAPGAQTPTYEDEAHKRGVTAHRPYTGGDILPSTAWHPEFVDVNNDGFIDLFISKGNVEAMTDFASRDPNNLLMGKPGGTFVEAGEQAGIATFASARGASLADFNLDGLPDLVVVNRKENVAVWRNMGMGGAERPVPMGNWLALRLLQEGANRDAVGAWIEVRIGTRTLNREHVAGGGHASGQAGWIHFGLGTNERARVRVRWPDGEWGPWLNIYSNQFVRIVRGQAQPQVWLPPSDEGKPG